MPAIFSLFNILALIYLFRSVQLSATVWRERQDIRQEPLTPRKKSLADQASYFIAVPIGVLLHELGHAVAVWLSGGRVAEFGYRVFWGYVVPEGSFTSTQNWFIAVAGTLGSLAFGLGIWLLFRRASSSTVRYFALRAFRFQVYFALIYYPLFTLIGFIGDWRTIYDFGQTPVLSGATAVAHAAILALFWYGSRIGWFEAPSHETAAEQLAFDQLEAKTRTNPQNAQLQLSYIDALRRGGAMNKAKHQLQTFLSHNPTSAEGYLQLAALRSQGQAQIPKQASEAATEALELGLPEPRQRAFAYQLIAQHRLSVGAGEAALEAVSQAVTAVSPPRGTLLPPAQAAHLVNLHLLRSQVLRRLKRYDDAYADIVQAQQYAAAAGNQQALQQCRSELETLEKNAGRTFDAGHSLVATDQSATNAP